MATLVQWACHWVEPIIIRLSGDMHANAMGGTVNLEILVVKIDLTKTHAVNVVRGHSYKNFSIRKFIII